LRYAPDAEMFLEHPVADLGVAFGEYLGDADCRPKAEGA